MKVSTKEMDMKKKVSERDAQEFIAMSFESYCIMVDASVLQVIRVDGITTCVGVSRRVGDVLLDAMHNRERIELEVAVDGSKPAGVFFDFENGYNCLIVGSDPDRVIEPLYGYIRDVLYSVETRLACPCKGKGCGSIMSHGTYRD